jgi:hypothetical protein
LASVDVEAEWVSSAADVAQNPHIAKSGNLAILDIMDAPLDIVASAFEHWTGIPAVARPGEDVDLWVEHPDVPGAVAVELVLSGTAPAVERAIARLERVSDRSLIVVRAATPAMARRCQEHGIGWLDHAGNAGIHWPGFVIHVQGRDPVPGAKPRRSPFAPKAARVIRVLASEQRPLQQTEIAELADIDRGYTSRIVRELEADGWLVRRNGRVEPTDVRALLDAWRERHRPQHVTLRGALAARTSDELVRDLVQVLGEAEIEVALTGLAAAWCYRPAVAYRRVTAYVSRLPSVSLLAPFGFFETNSAPALVLEVASDPWLWSQRHERQGLPCADPALVYADLGRAPERATEATEALWAWMEEQRGETTG